jgi:hypothetical protein
MKQEGVLVYVNLSSYHTTNILSPIIPCFKIIA